MTKTISLVIFVTILIAAIVYFMTKEKSDSIKRSIYTGVGLGAAGMAAIYKFK